MDEGDILPQIRRNFSINADVLDSQVMTKVIELNFFKPIPISDIGDVDVILVGDVIYDQTVTNSFFDCLKNILKSLNRRKPVHIFIAMERRSKAKVLDTLTIMLDGMESFLSGMTSNENCVVSKVDGNQFTQCFKYNNFSAEMYMWKICFNLVWKVQDCQIYNLLS